MSLAEQIATLESKLAAYESRKVPLSQSELDAAYLEGNQSMMAVARAALVAAESPAAVEAALTHWVNTPNGANGREAIRAALRAAHDAAIVGGCGAARESDEVASLRERVATLEAEAKCRIEEARANHKERDGLRRQLDETTDLLVDSLEALTKPIDGVEELGRIGWDAWQRAIDCPPMPHVTERSIAADNASAQAIASRVIGALRSALCNDDPVCEEEREWTQDVLEAFNNAVASLKIEPAPRRSFEEMAEAAPPPSAVLASTEPPKREPDDAEQIDTRPVVKVGQVWGYENRRPGTISEVGPGWASLKGGDLTYMTTGADGCAMDSGWHLVSDTPKREPFELPHKDYSLNDDAICDRIREIERRLEAGGL